MAESGPVKSQICVCMRRLQDSRAASRYGSHGHMAQLNSSLGSIYKPERHNAIRAWHAFNSHFRESFSWRWRKWGCRLRSFARLILRLPSAQLSYKKWILPSSLARLRVTFLPHKTLFTPRPVEPHFWFNRCRLFLPSSFSSTLPASRCLFHRCLTKHLSPSWLNTLPRACTWATCLKTVRFSRPAPSRALPLFFPSSRCASFCLVSRNWGSADEGKKKKKNQSKKFKK